MQSVKLLFCASKSFAASTNLDLKSLINQRVGLVKENIKSESIPEVFFQEAEKIRLDGIKTEAVVEAAYKRVINTKDCWKDLYKNMCFLFQNCLRTRRRVSCFESVLNGAEIRAEMNKIGY